MNKKIAWLSGIFSLAVVGLVTAAQAVSVEPGSNKVSVYSCVQVGNDIKIRRSSSDSEYILTSTCRDAGHGKRQYSMKCNSNKEYQVSWKECPLVADTQSPSLSFTASALKNTITNNTYSYRVNVTASDASSDIKGIQVVTKHANGTVADSFWVDNKNGLSASESGFGSKSVTRSITRTGLKLGEEYTVVITSYDTSGNVRTSSPFKVYLAPQDNVAPTIDANVSFASTWDVGYKTKRFVPTLVATANDNVKVTKIVLYHNTSYLWEGYAAVKTCENSSGVKTCSHVMGALTRGNFYAQAWDAAGNSVDSVRFAF